MLNDEQIAVVMEEDLEYVRARIPAVRDPETFAELMSAVIEIARNSVGAAGRGHVPIPSKEVPDPDYAALLTSVIALNARVLVGRPHSLSESERLVQIREAVRHLRIGVDSAT